MDFIEEIQSVLEKRCDYNLQMLLDQLQSIVNKNTFTTDNVVKDLIDLEFVEEIKNLIAFDNVSFFFGKSLRDLKCIIVDESHREHTALIMYRGPKKLVIVSINLPHSPLQDQEYTSLEELVIAIRNHIESLSRYFNELEKIDQLCTLMEPAHPSFKDDYRRILLDERTWLHVEVTPDGLATNIHLVGQSEQWSNKLQKGLLTWDHDRDITDNILVMFDLVNFPVCMRKAPTEASNNIIVPEETLCGICLCAELPEIPGVPLPLCQNPQCGINFHRNCLYQWLVACSGGRPPPFGVASGSCPACLDPITCCERDD